MQTTQTARRSLASFNETGRTTTETSDFVLATEFRVGRYGLVVSRDGYGSRGNGGKLIHLVKVTVIAEIKADYNWRPFCAQSARTSSFRTREQNQAAVERQIEEHTSAAYRHYCRQPQVGDIFYSHPQCVDQNATGKGAYEPSVADTSDIDCSNCLTRIFGETVEPRAKIEAREKAERAAAKAKNAPPVCFHCGDARPRTKATEAGEKLPCSNCKDLFTTIFSVETTGYEHLDTVRYLAGRLAEDPTWDANLKAAAIAAETRACQELERVEGRFAR